jgi:uncharacterized membrane protein
MVILHFPIVLFWTAFVYDLLGAVWKVHVYPAAHWILIVGAVLAIPTVFTGLEMAELRVGNPYVLIHRDWALATFSFALLHAAFRLYLIVRHRTVNKYILIFLSLITVSLVSITAEYGGRVAFGKTISKH